MVGVGSKVAGNPRRIADNEHAHPVAVGEAALVGSCRSLLGYDSPDVEKLAIGDGVIPDDIVGASGHHSPDKERSRGISRESLEIRFHRCIGLWFVCC